MRHTHGVLSAFKTTALLHLVWKSRAISKPLIYGLLFAQWSHELEKFRHDKQLTGTSRQLRGGVPLKVNESPLQGAWYGMVW